MSVIGEKSNFYLGCLCHATKKLLDFFSKIMYYRSNVLDKLLKVGEIGGVQIVREIEYPT